MGPAANRRPRAVFFDAGDTLLSPYPSFDALFTEVALANGESFEQAAVERALAASARAAAWPSDWTDPLTQREFWTDFYGDALERLGHRGDTAQLAVALHDAFADPAVYRVFPEVPDVLRELDGRGLVLGVISNFAPWLDHVLELQGVRQFFDSVTISGVVGVAKPDPAIFRHALADAGVAAEEAMHVGDQPAMDVEGARAVGMTPVLIDRFGRNPKVQAPVVTDLWELVALLDAGARG